MERVLNDRRSIFATVVKGALIAKSPDRVSNILDNKTRDNALFGITLKGEEENSKQIN